MGIKRYPTNYKIVSDEYDKKKAAFSKIYDSQQNSPHNIMFTKGANDEFIVEIYDNKKKLVLRAIYSVVGNYNMYNSVWYWAYNIFFIDRLLTEDSLVIKKYATQIKENYNKFDPRVADELYFMCNNGNFFVKHDNLGSVVRIASYLVDCEHILAVNYDENNDIISDLSKSTVSRVEFLFIKKILQIGDKL